MTEKTFGDKIRQRITQLERAAYMYSALTDAVDAMAVSIEKGKKIMAFGNGGSATQSSHLVAELVNKFYFVRPGLAAMSLTADMANLTSIANDSDYKYIFSRQLECLGSEGDSALGITTSGTSINVLEGLKAAKSKNITTIALCGENTAPLEQLGVDFIIPVQSADTPVIQEMHLFVLHTMAEILEKKFFGGNE